MLRLSGGVGRIERITEQQREQLKQQEKQTQKRRSSAQHSPAGWAPRIQLHSSATPLSEVQLLT